MRKAELTQEELSIIGKIYQSLDPLTLERARIVLNEVRHIFKDLTAIVERNTKLSDVDDVYRREMIK